MPKLASKVSRTHPALDQSKLIGFLGYNLRRASLRVARRYGKTMDRFRLKPAEFATLVILLDNRGASQKSLAHALAIDPPNMATLLDRLEHRGLVQRLRNPHDERARQLQVTAAGRRLAGRAAAAVDRDERKAIAILSPAESAAFMRLLGKLTVAEL